MAYQTQPPDDSSGRRYSKAFKYAFAVMLPNENISDVDPTASGTHGADGLGNRFVSLLLPQQLSMREPYATVVTVMQDGGKVIESKGQVLKMASISGTTGFLPPTNVFNQDLKPKPGLLIPNVNDIDGALGAVSGYLAFMKLRYLFRLYGDARRRGILSLQMHFFDYKNDDFWRIEPDSFDMQRSSRRPMSYDYNIAFKCIEYSDAGVIATEDVTDRVGGLAFNGLKGGIATPNFAANGSRIKTSGVFGYAAQQGLLATTSRFTTMIQSALGAINYCDAVLQRSLQYAISKLDDVVGVFQAAADVYSSQLALVPALLAQLQAALDNLSDTAEALAPENLRQEFNAWYLEVKVLTDHMQVQVGQLVGAQSQTDITDTDQRFSMGRMKQGATTDLIQEPPGSSGSLDANPFIGSSGLSLVTDVDSLTGAQYTTLIINVGEDVYSLARRAFGSIARFMDIVLINQLEFPYIVADVSQKPPNTLAWGESVLIPSTSFNTTGTTIAGAASTSAIPTTGGTVTTSSLPSQLIDDEAEWLPDQWKGYSVVATTGGSTQTLICNGNTDTQLTLNGNWTITITPATTTYAIQYNTFNPRRPLTADALAYGTDFLVVFGSDGRCDFALGGTGDLAAATGLDNFIQAITLRARCPIGSHPFHRSYGLPAPIGRPETDSVFVRSVFFIRRSLLSDPRVGKVRNVQLNLNGDTLMLSAEVQPVASRLARPITTQVGS